MGLGWGERLRKPVGQMGRCEGFGPGEEGGCGEPRRAKRPEGLGRHGNFHEKIKLGCQRAELKK
jgi:hypothetical protein